MSLTFVTSNQYKLEEAQQILDRKLERSIVEIDEIQSLEIEEVIEAKAKEAYERLGKPLIVTDTGLYIQDLDGFPGALIKWMYQSLGNQGISNIAGGSNAEAKTVIGFYDGESLKTYTGVVKGEITKKPRGNKGFGWDPVFRPGGSEKSFGEMEDEEKNSFSMRKNAFEKMKKKGF